MAKKEDSFDDENQLTLKGYVKFDVSLQLTGDKTKLHYEEFTHQDQDDIEK